MLQHLLNGHFPLYKPLIFLFTIQYKHLIFKGFEVQRITQDIEHKMFIP